VQLPPRNHQHIENAAKRWSIGRPMEFVCGLADSRASESSMENFASTLHARKRSSAPTPARGAPQKQPSELPRFVNALEGAGTGANIFDTSYA
jgi:hypothetical protein